MRAYLCTHNMRVIANPMRMLKDLETLGLETFEGLEPHEGSRPDSSPSPNVGTEQSHAHTAPNQR
jgi:hypothetical protein